MKKIIPLTVSLLLMALFNGCTSTPFSSFQVKNAEGIRALYEDANTSYKKARDLKHLNMTADELKPLRDLYDEAQKKTNSFLEVTVPVQIDSNYIDISPDVWSKDAGAKANKEFLAAADKALVGKSLPQSVGSDIGDFAVAVMKGVADLAGKEKEQARTRYLTLIKTYEIPDWDSVDTPASK